MCCRDRRRTERDEMRQNDIKRGKEAAKRRPLVRNSLAHGTVKSFWFCFLPQKGRSLPMQANASIHEQKKLMGALLGQLSYSCIAYRGCPSAISFLLPARNGERIHLFTSNAPQVDSSSFNHTPRLVSIKPSTPSIQHCVQID